MNHVRRFRKSRLSQFIAAGVLAGAGTSAFAADFALQSNQISWTLGTVTNTTTATVADTGVAETISLLRGNDATALPNVSFTLQDLGNTSQTYDLRLFMQVKSTTSSNEVEMRLGVVRVTTVAGEITGVTMVSNNADPDYETIEVYAKKESGGSTINLNASFATVSNLISNNGDDVTINVNNVVTELSNNNSLFDDIIERFAAVGSFDYVIGIQDINGDGAKIGTQASGAFTVSPFADPTIDLGGGALAGDFDATATYIGGTLNIVNTLPDGGGDGGDGGDGEDEDPVDVVDDEAITDLDNEADDLSGDVAGEIDSGNVSEETVTRTETASNTASDQTNTILQSENPVSTDNILDVVTTASKVSATSSTVANNTTSGTVQLVSNSVTILTNSAKALETVASRTDNQDSPLTEQQEAQVNTALDNLTTTAVQLSQQATTTQELQALANTMTSLVSSAKSMKVPITEGTMGNLVSNSKLLMRSAIRLATGGTGLPSEEQATAQLNADPTLLNKALNQLFPLPPTQHISSSAVQGNINNGANKRGVNLSAAARSNLQRGLGNGLGVANTVVPGTNGQGVPSTAATIAAEILLRILGGNSGVMALLNTDRAGGINAAEGDMTAEVTYDEETTRYKVRFGTEVYIGQAVGVKAVPAGLNPGLVMLADGRVAMVGSEGIAIELAPAPIDIFYFGAAVDAQNYTPTFRDNGSFGLMLSNSESFSGTFAYDNLGAQDVAGDCGPVTFAAPTMAPNKPNYAFEMKCGDSGVTQRILPFPAQGQFFSTLADLELDVSTDRNTGIVTVAGIGRFKPSFFVSNSRSAAEASYYTTNEGGFGIAFQGMDVNSDGVLDVKVITENNVQILYGVQ